MPTSAKVDSPARRRSTWYFAAASAASQVTLMRLDDCGVARTDPGTAGICAGVSTGTAALGSESAPALLAALIRYWYVVLGLRPGSEYWVPWALESMVTKFALPGPRRSIT